jgi:hypothetical protein
MKTKKEVKQMLWELGTTQADAEHMLAEHNLTESERRTQEKKLKEVNMQIPVLTWVLN